MNLIIYTDNDKYNMHCQEYKTIWSVEGDKIQSSFYKILSLPFKEKEIRLLINEGLNFSNSAGTCDNDNMNFRYNNRCKIGTFLHELSHRIVMEYNLFDKAKVLYDFKDIHELIDLFLYDIIVDLYGKSAGELRVEYESNFEEDIYRNSWLSILSMSFDERQKMLKNIIEVALDE